MLINSKEANKILKAIEIEYEKLSYKEEMSKTFISSINEDIESCRPKYNYKNMQEELKILEEKIIDIKHRINIFNTTTIVPEYNMAIDQMLIYIPQLTKRKDKLELMVHTLPKQRDISQFKSNIIDYKYTNYDIEEVEFDYKKTCDELSKAQIALDTINLNKTFEIEL